VSIGDVADRLNPDVHSFRRDKRTNHEYNEVILR
jgi:hypothetical protein